MNIEQINKVVKTLWGKTYRAVDQGDGSYKLLHTVGINGATGSAYGYFRVEGDNFIIRYVWAHIRDAMAQKVTYYLGCKCETYQEKAEDADWEWSVLKFNCA